MLKTLLLQGKSCPKYFGCMIRNSISSRVIDQPAQQVKGKSFRFFSFDKGQTYVNNDFYQDFVTYAGGLYACITSEVVNEIPDQSDK